LAHQIKAVKSCVNSEFDELLTHIAIHSLNHKSFKKGDQFYETDEDFVKRFDETVTSAEMYFRELYTMVSALTNIFIDGEGWPWENHEEEVDLEVPSE